MTDFKEKANKIYDRLGAGPDTEVDPDPIGWFASELKKIYEQGWNAAAESIGTQIKSNTEKLIKDIPLFLPKDG